MQTTWHGAAAIAAVVLLARIGGSAAAAPWVDFQEQTTTRLDAPADVGVGDVAEKDYAWGDLDHDGDVDLVVVRKEPWHATGKRRNVLLMNEGGVLVDRTAEFASATDVPEDQGFLTPTNDRDVKVVDVDLDGWLDVVVAVSRSASDPKHVGHPRVYINLGADGASGDWLGLRYEEARIPVMFPIDGQPGQNPNFGEVAAMDVTNDGYPDLWFGQDEPNPANFGDRLLINLGQANPGHFADETSARILAEYLDTGILFQEWTESRSVAMGDLNADGASDLVRVSPCMPRSCGFLTVAYNDGEMPGVFDGEVDFPLIQHPWFVSVSDLNNDSLPDLVVTDEGLDRYLINTTTEGSVASFTSNAFEFAHDGEGGSAQDAGYGGNNLVVDLDNDGWKDVVVADVNEDIAGCLNRAYLYRNLGMPWIDGEIVLREETSGRGCQTFQGNPPVCLVTGIPSNLLEGVHDVAVFDLDGDGWKDMILGRCQGTVVWMNLPPTPAGSLPDGGATSGVPLELARAPNGRITLSWDDSCAIDDVDYAIYGGKIHGLTAPLPVACSTAGATTRTLVPAAESTYYLVAPHNENREGAYGRTSAGVERAQSLEACLPRLASSCVE